jgi:electron transfer flavoprotein beta subunit
MNWTALKEKLDLYERLMRLDKPIGDIKEADLADLEKEKVGESNAKVQIVKLYEPAKKEAGIKIQEETPEDSAIKAVAMMADAKVF